MSKQSVPDVYAKVIRDVCETSRQDFEEGGVDLGALKLLEQGWQKRLSDLKISRFPWDPNPEPTPKSETSTVNSNAKPKPVTLPSNGSINHPPPSIPAPVPQVKQESQPNPPQAPVANAYQVPQFPQGQPMNAQQRAAMYLHQRYGDQAGNQIAQLQNDAQQRAPVVQSSQGQQSNQQPFIKQEDVSLQSFQQNYSPQENVKTSQTDGASDDRRKFEMEIARRRSYIFKHRDMGDQLMKEHVLATQQQLEGGGLLMPLDTHHFASSGTKRKLAGHTFMINKSSLSRAQADATGDDEDDEDAINSDLDDPDELGDNENEEDNVHEVMLCTYDKVQRVKNKWKCTLKDGILKVDGADYVFHKGQGEFEW